MLLHQEVKRSPFQVFLLQNLVDLFSRLESVHEFGGQCVQSLFLFLKALLEDREADFELLEHFVEQESSLDWVSGK